MAEPDNIVLEQLHAISDQVGKLNELQIESMRRLGSIENHVSNLGVGISNLSVRMDRIDIRLDRIEHRLGA